MREQGRIERSNRLAQPAIDAMARFHPEQLGRLGCAGVDEEVSRLSPEHTQEEIAAYQATARQLEQHRLAEQDPEVALDLALVRESLEIPAEKLAFENEHTLPYHDPLTLVFEGLRPLLIDPIEPHRRQAALTRLQRYAGLEKGYQPIIRQAQNLTRAHLRDPARLAPAADLLATSTTPGERLLDALGRLFELHALSGYEKPLGKLRRQHADHIAFLRQELLPRARTDARLPDELFAIELRHHGVDLPEDELARRAHVAFRETQCEMKSLATLLIRERGWSCTGYQDAIAELRQERIPPHALAAHYQERLARLAETAAETGLPRLTEGALRTRLANEAEQLVFPMPFLRLPPLLAPSAWPLAIVIPTHTPNAEGESEPLADYSFPAGTWTLAAHEGWPGHGLQFGKLIEQEHPIARSCFGYTVAGVEGWALYAEAEIRPRLPLEAQLVALQHRLLRAARAWLALALHQGLVAPQEALWWLGEQVGLTPALARVELRRAALRQPAEAIAYLAGYLRLAELRAEAERAAGSGFEPLRYHEALLGHGLLPLAALRQTVVATAAPALV